MNDIYLESASPFGGLVVGDRFIFEYELKWIKHQKPGTDWCWRFISKTEREEYVPIRREKYKIWQDQLPILGIYEKMTEHTYELREIVEDFRKNGSGKIFKHRGAAYHNLEVRKVL